MVFNNKILGSHYIVKERPPYKKDFDDADVFIVGNIRIDEATERKLYTPSFTVNDSYKKDEKSVRLVEDLKEGKTFHSIDFRRFDLGGAELNEGDFTFSTFDETNMIGVKLKGANLKGASLVGADLRGADLSGANLEGADLRYCNLEGAKLDGANLSGTKIDGAFFKAAKLNNIKADKKTISELETLMQMMEDLVMGKISIKDIPKEWLSFIDLTKFDLSGMDLTNFDLRLLNTVGVDLSSAILTPDQIDGTYMFKSGADSNTIVKVKRGNTAGLDLTSVNLINDEIEEKKRQDHVREIITKRAREESLKVIEAQKSLIKESSKEGEENNYLKQRPCIKRFLGENECDGVDLEEKMLVIEKNRMMNPESEWDIPRSDPRVNRELDKIITEDFMSDIKPADYGYKYEQELEEKNLKQQNRQQGLDGISHGNSDGKKDESQSEEQNINTDDEEQNLAKKQQEDRLKVLGLQVAEDTDSEEESDNDTGNIDLISKQGRQNIRLNVRNKQHNKA